MDKQAMYDPAMDDQAIDDPAMDDPFVDPSVSPRRSTQIRPGYNYYVARLFDKTNLTCLVSSPSVNLALIAAEALPIDACVLKLPQTTEYDLKFEWRRSPKEEGKRFIKLEEYCIVLIRLSRDNPEKEFKDTSRLFKAYIVEGAWADVFVPVQLAEEFLVPVDIWGYKEKNKGLLRVISSDLGDCFAKYKSILYPIHDKE